jgi:hypothetical protein
MPVRIPQNRTPATAWESLKDSYVSINPLAVTMFG